MSEDQPDAADVSVVAQRALAKCVSIEQNLTALEQEIDQCRAAVTELEGRLDE